MTFETSIKNALSLAKDIVDTLQLHGHTSAAGKEPRARSCDWT